MRAYRDSVLPLGMYALHWPDCIAEEKGEVQGPGILKDATVLLLYGPYLLSVCACAGQAAVVGHARVTECGPQGFRLRVNTIILALR